MTLLDFSDNPPYHTKEHPVSINIILDPTSPAGAGAQSSWTALDTLHEGRIHGSQTLAKLVVG